MANVLVIYDLPAEADPEVERLRLETEFDGLLGLAHDYTVTFFSEPLPKQDYDVIIMGPERAVENWYELLGKLLWARISHKCPILLLTDGYSRSMWYEMAIFTYCHPDELEEIFQQALLVSRHQYYCIDDVAG